MRVLELKKPFLFLLLFFASLKGYALEFNSGAKQVHLIELYTSQSCSSCPPAEAWFNDLKSSDKLWTDFIPVSFHVSYWNHLSWKDQFSKQKYSDRQRRIHQVIQAGVYTPQVILSGKDLRNWRRTKDKSFFKPQLSPGNLKISVDKNFKSASLQFFPKSFKGTLGCFGAYIESGHPTKITSGENRGRNITQDFIVRNLFSSNAIKEKSNYTCTLNLNFNNNKKHKEKAIVFWVIDKSNYRVIQATGGKI